jgi:hypothetical protein
MRGGGVAGSQPMITAVYTGAQINFGDLTPYLTYEYFLPLLSKTLGRDIICSNIAGGGAAAAESLQHPRRSEVRPGDQGRGGTRGAGGGGPLARLHRGTAAALEAPSANTRHSASVDEDRRLINYRDTKAKMSSSKKIDL